MTLTVYGIPNCDTVKKARTWLEGRGLEFSFHDYRKDGVDTGRLAAWCDVLGWETVLNRSGTTFRKLSEAERTGLNLASAVALMVAQPAMIKRPLVEFDGGLLVGFKPDLWAETLA